MLIYGKQPINYMLDHHLNKIQKIYLAKELDKKEYSKLMKTGIEIARIPQKAASSMAKNGNHQGFLADVDEISLQDATLYQHSNFIVVLNGLTDVGNIGALIRSAYALGVDGIVISGLKHIALAPIVRTSTGALFDMPLIVQHNILDVLNELKLSGFESYAAAMEGQDIRTVSPAKKRALILGNEGEGIPNKIMKKIDHQVSIQMEHDFDSLNVSVAGAILIDRMR